MCVNNLPWVVRESERPKLEPVTYWLQVRRPNHYATTPHRLIILSALSKKLVLVYSEWYSYHFPELVKLVPDNYTYARVAQYIGNRKQLSEDRLEGLEKILVDSEKTRAIYDASRSSMGNAIS